MYKIYNDPVTAQPAGVFRTNADGSTTCIPNGCTNLDGRLYQDWVAAGNTPEPADV